MSLTHTLLNLILSFSLLISLSSSTTTTTTTTTSSYSKPQPHRVSYKYFIITACNATTYPALCRKTCLPYASKIKADPQKLVIAALSATLSAAQFSVTTVAVLSKQSNLAKYEAAAIGDCIEEMGDSIDELKQSISEMKDIGANDMRFKISNVLTWMSAAITDENTCMDGIGEKRVSPDVKRRIRGCVLGVAKLTSNALSLCNHIQNYKSLLHL